MGVGQHRKQRNESRDGYLLPRSSTSHVPDDNQDPEQRREELRRTTWQIEFLKEAMAFVAKAERSTRR